MKYMSYLKSRFSKPDFPTFRVSDLRLAFSEKGIDDDYLYLMVHNLEKRGEIKRITRGIYTFHNDVSVIGFAFLPFYYGFENALTIRGISLQGTNPIVVTPRNVRQGVRVFKGRNYLVKRIPSNLFFGYDLLKRGSFWIPVSNLEKTIIDMMYFDNYIRDELWSGILKELDMKRLREYLKRYKKRFRDEMLKTISEERRRSK
jgi:predicted transcriptional regulator of viral defense system